MLRVRRSGERGDADHGWLKSHHSFSFADYYNPEAMGFGNLRVINEDWIAAGKGFGTHGHRDMEIVTYVVEGMLAHEDSMGNVKAIPPGDVQRMSAGTGVQHSEFNHAPDQTTHLLQIWILPKFTGIRPGDEQKTVPAQDKRGKLRLVASPDGASDSVTFNAGARMYAGLFDGDEQATLPANPERKVYVHLVRGELEVNGERLQDGDAAMLEGESLVTLQSGRDAEVLVFDQGAAWAHAWLRNALQCGQ